MPGLLVTTSLTAGQWAACLGLALLVPISIDLRKIWPRRHRLPRHQRSSRPWWWHRSAR